MSARNSAVAAVATACTLVNVMKPMPTQACGQIWKHGPRLMPKLEHRRDTQLRSRQKRRTLRADP